LPFSIAYAAMNHRHQRRHVAPHFSIAYAAMNVVENVRGAQECFSIAYAAMNRTDGAILGWFSDTYATNTPGTIVSWT
jgi:hypothetical protein